MKTQIKYLLLILALFATMLLAHAIIFAPPDGPLLEGAMRYPILRLVYVLIAGIGAEKLGRKWFHGKDKE